MFLIDSRLKTIILKFQKRWKVNVYLLITSINLTLKKYITLEFKKKSF